MFALKVTMIGALFDSYQKVWLNAQVDIIIIFALLCVLADCDVSSSYDWEGWHIALLGRCSGELCKMQHGIADLRVLHLDQYGTIWLTCVCRLSAHWRVLVSLISSCPTLGTLTAVQHSRCQVCASNLQKIMWPTRTTRLSNNMQAPEVDECGKSW